jgi:hypothetical protein
MHMAQQQHQQQQHCGSCGSSSSINSSWERNAMSSQQLGNCLQQCNFQLLLTQHLQARLLLVQVQRMCSALAAVRTKLHASTCAQMQSSAAWQVLAEQLVLLLMCS